MPSRHREQQPPDRLWERVKPLMPPRPAQPKGGRPFAGDRACFAGIVYQLRNGIRWNDMPAEYQSGVTCWRRHRDWTAAGVWDGVWKLVLRELAEAGRLRAEELALDGTNVEAKRGGAGRAGSARAPRSRSSPTATAPRPGRRPTGRASTR